MEASWAQQRFAEAYMRTYKKASELSKKNLRCFPECSLEGHHAAGFCGRQVRLELRQAPGKPPPRVWARFEERQAAPRFLPGEEVAAAELETHSRSRAKPLEPWIPGPLYERGAGVFEATFNEALLGWHYQWLSTKGTCDDEHVFRVYVFYAAEGAAAAEGGVGEAAAAPGPSSRLRFESCVDSPPFTLYTRHRQKAGANGSPGEVAAAAPQEPQQPISGVKRGVDAFDDASAGQRVKQEKHDEKPASAEVLPVNRTLDRLVRFICTFGATPNPKMIPAELGAVDTKAHLEEEFDKDLDFVLDLIQEGDDLDPDILGLGAVENGSGPLSEEEALMAPFAPAEAAGAAEAAALKPKPESKPPPLPLHAQQQERRPEGTGPPDLEKVFADTAAAQEEPEHPSCGLAASSGLQAVLEEHYPAESAEARRSFAESFMCKLETLVEYMLTMLLRSNSVDFVGRMIDRWSSLAGLEELRVRLELERSIDFEWTPEHEDETFEEDRMSDLREVSIYAEVRQGFRRVIAKCLRETGLSVEEFALPMELAARHNILSLDAFHAPNDAGAATLHVQLYGTLEEFPGRDYGAGGFKTPEQQRSFGKDLLICKRLVTRGEILQQIRLERQLARLEARKAAPVAPEYDVSGTWEEPCLDKQGRFMFRGAINAVSANPQVGTFFSALFEHLWSKLTIRLTANHMVMIGRKVLLAHPKLVLELDAPFPQRSRAPRPLPVDGVAALLAENISAAWLHEDAEGNKGVVLAHDNPAAADSTAELVRRARTVPKREGTPHAAINEWLAGLELCEADERDIAQMRFTHFFFRNTATGNLEAHELICFEARSRAGPAITDKEGYMALRESRNVLVMYEARRTYLPAQPD